MVQRCTNPNAHAYEAYGGRGIAVWGAWLENFEQFLEDMGERPSKKHTLDRINNDGNYEPSNCRWATWEEQQNNRSNRVEVFYLGRQMSIREAINLTGSTIPIARIHGRINAGWDIHRALTEKQRHLGRPTLGGKPKEPAA